LRAKKHLGQHFLIDDNIIHKILQVIAVSCDKETPILEVGPGPGVLTHHLAKAYPHFVAIDVDRDMIAHLSQKIDRKHLLLGDFLRLDFQELFDARPLHLVGNFPYNISSQIIFKMLENRDQIPLMVGMFQKEVADRISAGPGTKANGIISILTQVYYETESLFDVPPEAFDPPPKVQSSVIKLKRLDTPRLEGDVSKFKTIVKMAFGQRRKKLRNTLKQFVVDEGNPLLQKRPEQLGVEEWIELFEGIEK